jgi:3-phosphoshikimate 1-carboxyvinyltransferase
LFNAIATGPALVRGLLDSEDVAATAAAVRAFGATIEEVDGGVRITPAPSGVSPQGPIDCGNSGTSIRLLAGLLVGSGLTATLTGDDSLRGRPMGRIVDPLRAMGASIEGAENGKYAPLHISPATLTASKHDLTIASAQVKSCLLLAGRHVGVSVREPKQSRDHSERMLRAMGATLTIDGGWLHLEPVQELSPVDVLVPGDVSAAAFWLVAASIVPGSELALPGVGSNRTRTGVVDALLAMGADIEQGTIMAPGSEPVCDLLVRSADLGGARLGGELALRALDELPVLAVAAANAYGKTVISDAGELRVKESDRISRVVTGLRACGVEVDEHPDGMTIHGCAGAIPGGGTVDAHGDHRIAMAFAVASLNSKEPIQITGAQSVRSSYPAFRDHLESVLG